MYFKFYFLCYYMQENEKLSCLTIIGRNMETLWIYLKFYRFYGSLSTLAQNVIVSFLTQCVHVQIMVHFNILTNLLQISLLFFKIVYKVLSYDCSLQLPHHNFVLSLKFTSFQQQNIQERLNLDYCAADKPEFYDALP